MTTQPEIIRQSELLNQLVLDRKTMEELGRIEVLWAHPQSHKVFGFIGKSGFLGAKKSAFKLTQIQALGSNGVLIQGPAEATDADKVNQLETPIHREVWSDTGNKIGKITDYLFNLKTGAISDYLLVSNGWGGIIGEVYRLPPHQVLSFGRKRVLVADATARSLNLYQEGIKQKVAKVGEGLKEDYTQATNSLREKLPTIAEQAKGRWQNLADLAKERAQALSQQAKEKVEILNEQLREETQVWVEQARQHSQTLADQVRERTETFSEQVEEGIQTLTVQAREILDTPEDAPENTPEDQSEPSSTSTTSPSPGFKVNNAEVEDEFDDWLSSPEPAPVQPVPTATPEPTTTPIPTTASEMDDIWFDADTPVSATTTEPIRPIDTPLTLEDEPWLDLDQPSSNSIPTTSTTQATTQATAQASNSTKTELDDDDDEPWI